MSTARQGRLFPALLKFWRQHRGLSQLALSVEAEVSLRHLSFLETGRAHPSQAMVLRLAAVLAVPLRDQDDLLSAAGFSPRSAGAREVPAEVHAAMEHMLQQHEPFPMVVLSLEGDVLRTNRGATSLFSALADGAPPPAEPLNIYEMHFNPAQLRPWVVGWEALAHSMLARLHREALQRQDPRLHHRLESVAAHPGVREAWRNPHLQDDSPTQVVRYQRGDLRASFMVTATTFVGPRQAALDELRLEACFPTDGHTRALCERLATNP
jgi:transcriptional regulator with XRE-family HTH domain